MHANLGGFRNYNGYVENLRSYTHDTNPQIVQNAIKKGRNNHLANKSKDHFVEGQLSIRQPKVRNCLADLQDFQRTQCDKLSVPRRVRLNEIQDQMNDMQESYNAT